MYVYIQTEPNLFTVGFFDPKGKWHPESDFNNREEAAQRVHYMNGLPRYENFYNHKTIKP